VREDRLNIIGADQRPLAVIRGLIEISLKPSMDLQKLAIAELSGIPDSDLLLPFSLACRADLKNGNKTVT
jgi:hypothetical protein